VVIKYNDRGFGFIQLLSLKNINCDEIFFHVSKVKKTGIEPKLVELEKDNTKVIKLWFTTEETEKGTALKDCWLNPTEIPNEYLVDFVENIGIHLTSMEKEKSFESFFDMFNQSITQTKKIAINKQLSKTKTVVKKGSGLSFCILSLSCYTLSHGKTFTNRILWCFVPCHFKR